MESSGKKGAIYRKNPSRDWLEKDQCQSVVSAQSLSWEEGKTQTMQGSVPLAAYEPHVTLYRRATKILLRA